VIVLDPLRAAVSVPVIGVFPPIREAIKGSKTKEVAVLGVRSMITSEAMRAFVDGSRTAGSKVFLVNASSLVDLVENFTFINDPRHTQEVLTRFVTDVRGANPGIDVMTMSSTHLPWLKPFFTTAAPDVSFLDPADTVLGEIDPYTSNGEGRTRCVATETAELTLQALNAAFRALGAPLQARLKGCE
jgi:glutamate racemase